MRTFRLGLKSLMLHKLRSTLTMLGMLFGVAAVIAMLAVGEGASFEARERYKAMGTTNILIRSKKPPATEQSSSESVWSAVVYGLTYKEFEEIQETLTEAKHVVAVRETTCELRHSAEWTSSVVIGTSPEYIDVVNMKVAEGRWLSELDVDEFANVAVLGARAAQTLFPLTNPLGEMVDTGGDNRFVVVGVLDYQGRAAGASGTTLDECMFVPISSSRRRYGDERTNSSGGSFSRERVELHEIKVMMKEAAQVTPAADVLRHMISEDHESTNDVDIAVPLELLEQEEASARTFSILIGAIAAASLLVGGIGIMNVMLATVTERTREIGIRRALGARKKHIIYQFLVETLVLTIIGGLVGIALGWALPNLMTRLTGETTIFKWSFAVIAFVISTVIGVVFGIYPAWRAANMDPVEALRHE